MRGRRSKNLIAQETFLDNTVFKFRPHLRVLIYLNVAHIWMSGVTGAFVRHDTPMLTWGRCSKNPLNSLQVHLKSVGRFFKKVMWLRMAKRLDANVAFWHFNHAGEGREASFSHLTLSTFTCILKPRSADVNGLIQTCKRTRPARWHLWKKIRGRDLLIRGNEILEVWKT